MMASVQRGFTLIELMIGLVVVSIMLSLGMPIMASWLQSMQVRNATESILAGLQLARIEAIRGNTQVNFSMPNSDTSWTVAQVSPATTIQTRTAAEGTPNARIDVSPFSITFDGLGRANITSTQTIQVTNPTGGACGSGTTSVRCLNIVVTVGGQIKMCDPLATTTGDSRKC